MQVLDLETSTNIEQANKTRKELLIEENATFICACMTAEVGERNFPQCTYGRKESEHKILNLMPDTYFTWNGSRFDLFFIYHLLRKNGYKKIEDESSHNRTRLRRGQFKYLIANNKIISFDFKNHNGIVQLRDACLLFSCSLEKFINNTCPELPKKVGTYDYSKYREFPKDFSDSDKIYCKGDVEGFGIGLHRMQSEFAKEFNGLDILESLTAGSFAMKYAKEYFGKDIEKLFPPCDMPREFIYGGRTFLNAEYKNQVMHDLLKIDANSFYPSIMARTKLPCGKMTKQKMTHSQLKDYANKNPTDYIFAHMLEGFAEYDDMYSPIVSIDSHGVRVYPKQVTHLDKIYLDDNIIRDEKFSCEGTFDVFIYDSRVGLFPYMEELFKMKNKYKFEKKPALELAVKIILNSTYGKFIQKDIVNEQDFDEHGLIVHTGNMKQIQAWHIYVALGSAITANCRYILTTAMNELQERFIYSDTDSLIFYGEPPSTCKLGYNLGEWKIENDKDENGNIIKEDGIFFGRKSYGWTHNKGKAELTYCGISKKAIKKHYPDGVSIEQLKEDMKLGITFDVLQGNQTLNGVVLVERARTKKSV